MTAASFTTPERMLLQERNRQQQQFIDSEKFMTVAGYLSGKTNVGGGGSAASGVLGSVGALVEVPPSNEINVAQLRQVLQQREIRQRETFRLLLERCYKNIRACAAARKYACAFDVPLFVAGRPLYDVMRCIEYIIRNLTTNGYAVQYSYPRYILISWAILQEKQQAAVLSSIARLQELSVSHATAVQKQQQAQEGAEAMRDVERFSAATTNTLGATTNTLPTTAGVAAAPRMDPIPPPPPAVARKKVFKDIAEFKPSGKFVLHM